MTKEETLFFYVLIDIFAVTFLRMADLASPKSYKSTYASRMYFADRSRWHSLFLTFLSFAVLFIALALRDRVGADYDAYADAYLSIVSGALTEIEKDWLSVGFRFLASCIGIVAGNDYRVMFAVIGFITLLYFYRAILNLSVSRSLSLYLLICFCLYYQMFNQSRQMMALAIGVYAFRYIKERAPAKFLVHVAAASSLHTSAAILCVLFVIRDWPISWRSALIYVGTVAGAFVGFDIIVQLVSYTNYGATYFGWDKYDVAFVESSMLNTVARGGLLLGCLFYARGTVRRAPYTIGLYNAVIVCSILQIVTLKSYLFGRLTTYFFVFYIFLIPEVLKTALRGASASTRVLVYSLVYLLFGAYHFVYYYSGSGAAKSGYDLYKSFF